MVAVHYVLGRHTLVFGLYGDRHAVFVAASYKHHFLPFGAQVSHIDVGRHIYSGQVSYMHRPVCIGQCGGHQGPLEILVHIMWFG